MRELLTCIGIALVIGAELPSFAQQSSEAWQVADRLVESLGGREAWANARSLYVQEKAFPASIAGPVKAEFWRDLEVPTYRSRIEGPSIRRETSWTANAGWVIRDGVRTELSADDISSELSGWRQEPYVMYHLLALQDSSLHLVLVDGNRLEIYDGQDGSLLCWFVVDASGAPLRWGNVFEGEVNEHVYGPLRSFGNVSMPSWGTSTTGSWRFEYVQVTPLMEPIEIGAN
jgi:hypothetical protein